MNKPHHLSHPKWSQVELVARMINVPAGTIRTWRHRGVPSWARLKIISASKGGVTLADFEAMDTEKEKP